MCLTVSYPLVNIERLHLDHPLVPPGPITPDTVVTGYKLMGKDLQILYIHEHVCAECGNKPPLTMGKWEDEEDWRMSKADNIITDWHSITYPVGWHIYTTITDLDNRTLIKGAWGLPSPDAVVAKVQVKGIVAIGHQFVYSVVAAKYLKVVEIIRPFHPNTKGL